MGAAAVSKLTIYYRSMGAVPRGLRRGMGGAIKAAYEATGLLWQQKFLPKHFETVAYKEYGYEPRAGLRPGDPKGKWFWRSYVGRKIRYLGHNRPLVYSGKSRERALAGRVIATKKEGRVTIPAPALNRLPGQKARQAGRPVRSQIDMRWEVTRISEREKPPMIRAFDKRFIRALRAIKYPIQKNV